MTTHPPGLLVLIAGFGLSLLPCAAQEGERVTVRFVSFPRAIDPEPVEIVIGEGRTVTVEIPSNELSQAYKLPRLATWTVGETAEGADGKPAFKVFGKAKALASPSQLILLVRKGEAYSDGFELIPIDNRATRFGGGKFLFMNAAKVQIAGEVGSAKFAIKPGAHTIIQPRPAAGGTSVHAALYFRKGSEVKNFFSSQWPLSEDARSLIIFYHEPDTQRLRMHTIRDFS